MERIEEDEIDLRDLFRTIWNKRFFILIFTFMITAISFIYVLVNNPTPIYKGTLLVEIGLVQSENFGDKFIDNSNNLSKVVSTKFTVIAKPVKRTSNLIELVVESSDKNKIQTNIIEALDFIKERHKEKSKLYKNSIQTKEIGEVIIGNTPINKPKKKLIVVVAFVTGFVLSIFIVFFMAFISSMREDSKKEEENNEK